MKLPKREDWLNDKMIGFVMEAKKLDREGAIAHLEEKYRRMKEAIKNGASDEEIARVSFPTSFEEFTSWMFMNELRKGEKRDE